MCSTWSDFLISIKYFPRCCLYLFPPAQNKLGFTHTSLAEAQCVQPKLRAVRNLVPQEWLLELSPRHDHRWEAGVLVRRDHCHLGGEDALSALYFTMSLFVIPSIWGTGSTECTHWLSLCFFYGCWHSYGFYMSMTTFSLSFFICIFSQAKEDILEKNLFHFLMTRVQPEALPIWNPN